MCVGPRQSLPTGWGLIRRELTLEDPAPSNLYLGCYHEPIELKTAGGTAQGIAYNMESYLQSSVDRYVDLATKATGQAVKL